MKGGYSFQAVVPYGIELQAVAPKGLVTTIAPSGRSDSLDYSFPRSALRVVYGGISATILQVE